MEEEENNELQAENREQDAPSVSVNVEDADALLKESMDALEEDYDGFLLFEDSIEDSENLDPARPAKRNRFLSSPDKKGEREALKAKLQTWLDLVTNSDELSDLIAKAEDKSTQAEKTFDSNLKTALDATRELEISYRTVGAFFSNAGGEADKVMFLNTSMEDIQNLDDSKAYEALKEKYEETYNNFDLENTIGALIIPGYLGRKAVVSKYARLANEYKSLLLTDYYDADNFKDLIKDFRNDKLAGTDKYLSNAVMCSVYIQGRETNTDLGEAPLYIPPSAYLAGKIYNSHESSSTTVAQPGAGEKYGEMLEAEEVKFHLKKSETGDLEELGLVPMVKIRGKVVSMSAKTLFNGDNLDLKQYAIVRIYDWVTKILIDYLNRKTFELFTASNRRDIYQKIVSFLDDLVRSGVIKKFSKPEIKADPTDATRVYVNVGITPLYATRAFHISLKGEQDNEGKGTVSENND